MEKAGKPSSASSFLRDNMYCVFVSYLFCVSVISLFQHLYEQSSGRVMMDGLDVSGQV